MAIRGCRRNMVRYVYVDVLALVNIIVNYVILSVTGMLAGKTIRPVRLLTVSAIGSAYAVSALFVSAESLYSLPARIAFGLFMIAASYPTVKGLGFLVLASCFYLSSAIVAGTALALFYGRAGILSVPLAAIPGNPSGIAWWMVVLALAVLAVFPLLAKAGGIRPGNSLPLIGLELVVEGQTLGLTALVDTGNNLRDPVSGLPVVVVDWESLKSIMPSEVVAFFLSTWDSLPDELVETSIGRRLRLIPYENVSGMRGVLPGFKPEHLSLLEDSGGRTEMNAIVGVSGQPLSPSGLYQALLHPDLIS